MIYYSAIQKIMAHFQFASKQTVNIFCIVFLLKNLICRPRKEKLTEREKYFREQEEKIREEVDSEEEWRAIITSTDNGKKEQGAEMEITEITLAKVSRLCGQRRGVASHHHQY